MARDSRNALVALNRFGFGARGGASGDFVNAASDPRGFVKAELARPRRRAAGSAGAAIDAATGQSRVRLSVRAAAGPRRRGQARRAATEAAPQQPAPDAKPPQSRSLSLANVAAGHLAKGAAGSAGREQRHGRDHGAAETMQPDAAPHQIRQSRRRRSST